MGFSIEFRMDTVKAAAASAFVLLSLLLLKRRALSGLILGRRKKRPAKEVDSPAATEAMATPPTRPSMGREDDIFYTILRQYRGSDSGRKSLGVFKFKPSEG